MFFTSILKFCSSCYFSTAFQSNVGCFGTELPVLGLTCTDLASFMGFFASLAAIIAALGDFIAALCLPASCFV